MYYRAPLIDKLNKEQAMIHLACQSQLIRMILNLVGSCNCKEADFFCNINNKLITYESYKFMSEFNVLDDV